MPVVRQQRVRIESPFPIIELSSLRVAQSENVHASASSAAGAITERALTGPPLRPLPTDGDKKPRQIGTGDGNEQLRLNDGSDNEQLRLTDGNDGGQSQQLGDGGRSGQLLLGNGNSESSLEADVTKGVSKEDYAKLRKKTPSPTIRKMVNPDGEKLDPVYGYKVDRLEADHIVPMKTITEMDGFNQLRIDQQVEVLNLPENLVGLGKSTNASKGDKNWSDWKGHSMLGDVPETVRNEMLQREQAALIALDDAIKERLSK